MMAASRGVVLGRGRGSRLGRRTRIWLSPSWVMWRVGWGLEWELELEEEEVRRQAQVVVVPYHSLGEEVASCVFSKAVWRYWMGVRVLGWERSADSIWRDQKWRIRRDQRLFVLVLAVCFLGVCDVYGFESFC